jgi:cell wall-associated NlpC family hydrolase
MGLLKNYKNNPINQNPLEKVIKTILKVIITIILTYIVFSIVLVSNKPNTSKAKDAKRGFIEPILVKKKNLSATNSDGTTNGINLLLINSIQGEGFVKEYLTLARDNAEGKLNDYQYHIPVEGVIGMTLAEQGAYEHNKSLPLTPLKWDSTTNSPMWDKSKGITLSQATKPTYYRVGYEPEAWINNIYVSQFQMTPSYFDDTRTYKPSNMLGEGMTPGRTKGDWAYFPDQLSMLDKEYSNKNGIDITGLDSTAQILIASLNHNVGTSWKEQFLSKYKNGNYTEGTKDLTALYKKQFEKYESNLSKVDLSPSDYKWLAAFFLLEDGWHLTNRAIDISPGRNSSYIAMSQANKTPCLRVFKAIGLGTTDSEMQSYLQSKLKEPSDWGDLRKAGTQGSMWKDYGNDGIMYTLLESNGHVVSSCFIGQIYYARMLKFAGVGVDPTNPTTYRNVVSGTNPNSGLKNSSDSEYGYDPNDYKNTTGGNGNTNGNNQWVPSGSTDWMVDYHVDINSLTPGRKRLLEEAKKMFGSWYVWGGSGANGSRMDYPLKDSSGNWIYPDYRRVGDTWVVSDTRIGLDCSSFTRTAYWKAFNLDIGGSTIPQYSTGSLKTIFEGAGIPNLDSVNPKPGDIVLNVANHVSMYVGKDSNGKFWCFEAKQSKTQIGGYIKNWSGFSYYRIRTWEGIDTWKPSSAPQP